MSPTETDDVLVDLERAGWRALASSGSDVRRFYGAVLAADPVFVLPGGLVLTERDAIIDSMLGAPWSHHELSDVRVAAVGEDARAVVYRATARRGDTDYEALVTSTYAQIDNGWRLVLHQQTPA